MAHFTLGITIHTTLLTAMLQDNWKTSSWVVALGVISAIISTLVFMTGWQKAEDYIAWAKQTYTERFQSTRPSSELSNAIRVHGDRYRNFCNTPEYLPIFQISSCSILQITIAQLNDKRKLPIQYREVLIRFSTDVHEMNLREASIWRKLGGETGFEWAASLERYETERQANLLSLLDGKKSIGEFNSARKLIYDNRTARNGEIKGRRPAR